MCDVFGAIPFDGIDKDINCKAFEAMPDAMSTLLEWKQFAPDSTIEGQYIQSLMNAMNLIPMGDLFEPAVSWLYTLPDSLGVRAIKAAIVQYDTELPI
jgi:hypothetical protein